MTTKEWLNRGWKLDKEIDALLSEQRRAFDIACSTTTSLTQDKVQTSQSNSAENKFINYANYSKMIDDRIDELYAIKQEILQAINTVDGIRHREILTRRYLDFESIHSIATKMNVTDRAVKKMHIRAIEKIENTICSVCN